MARPPAPAASATGTSPSASPLKSPIRWLRPHLTVLSLTHGPAHVTLPKSSPPTCEVSPLPTRRETHHKRAQARPHLGLGFHGNGEAKELAVVGRERSPRHMSYAVQGRLLRALAATAGAVAVVSSPPRSPLAAAGTDGGAPRRWRSRREVVDWLVIFYVWVVLAGIGCKFG